MKSDEWAFINKDIAHFHARSTVLIPAVSREFRDLFDIMLENWSLETPKLSFSLQSLSNSLPSVCEAACGVSGGSGGGG